MRSINDFKRSQQSQLHEISQFEKVDSSFQTMYHGAGQTKHVSVLPQAARLSDDGAVFCM